MKEIQASVCVSRFPFKNQKKAPTKYMPISVVDKFLQSTQEVSFLKFMFVVSKQSSHFF